MLTEQQHKAILERMNRYGESYHVALKNILKNSA